MADGQLKLPIGSYALPNPQASSQILLNVYPEQTRNGKQDLILKRAPGIREFAEVTGPDLMARGAIFTGGVLYAVIGGAFYSITALGVKTLLSGVVVITGTDRVKMDVNMVGTIFIVTPYNGFGYTWDGATFALVSDPVFTGFGASNVGFIDGYFVFPVLGTAQFFNSGINAVTFNALDVATVEGKPGPITAFIVDHRELFFGKGTSSELWYNSANPQGSPFSRSPNGFLEYGVATPDSLVQQDNSLFWFAPDKTFRRLDGGTAVRISQHGIESAIERFTTISDCYGIPYTQEGHLFIAWSFPFEGRTFVYDCTTKEWHERDSLGYGAWRPNFIIQAYDKQIVGDSRSGKLGILDSSTHEEWGEPQRIRWRYQTVYAQRNKVLHKRFELVLNAGSGTLSGQGQNPLATLRYSNDGGMTYITRQVKPIGRRGNYRTSTVWWQLGESKDRVYEIEITDPVPVYAADTVLMADGGRL